MEHPDRSATSTPIIRTDDEDVNSNNTLFHQSIFDLSHSILPDVEKSVSPCDVEKGQESDSNLIRSPSKTTTNKSIFRSGRIGTKPNMDSPNFVELLEEQLDLRLASSNSPTAVMELDLDGTVRYLSKNWETIVGTTIKKIVNRSISTIIVGNNEEDLNVFHNAIAEMIGNNGSYKVKFVTATNDINKNKEKESGNLTSSNSLENVKTVFEPEPNEISSFQIDGDDQTSSISSKFSNNGEAIELEAQGILIHDSKTKLPTHSMWTIKPFLHIDLDLTIPENLIDLLGFGAEILEGYLFNLQELGIIDEESVPQPKLILCRVCESQIPAWFIEKHSDFCILEYRVNEELQNCHDFVNEQKSLIMKIYESLQATNSPMSSSSSSLSSNASSSSSLVLEYKGMPLPTASDSSPRLAPLKSSQSILQNRKFPFGILQRLIDLCDEALLINPAESDENGEFQFSPSSESALSAISNWHVFETTDLAIRILVEDTQALVNDKIDCVSRLISVLQYSEKLKNEVDESVLSIVKETVAKIKEQTMINELRYSDDSKETINSNELTPSDLNVRNKAIISPHPSRARSPSSFFTSSFLDEGIKSLSPKDLLGKLSDSPLQSSIIPRARHLSAEGSRNNSDELMATLNDLDLNKRNSETTSNNSSFSSPRRHLSPAPYVEKQKMSSYQRNTNFRFDSNTPSSSPSIYIAENSENILGEKRSSSTAGHINISTSNRSSISKPPLSPLLALSTPTSKPSSGEVRDYEILKPISKGAFGSVFLAQRKLTGDYVAIKCLKKRDMIAKNQVLNVKSERAVMMKQTDSPYVAQLYSTFQSKDYLYLVMEYFNGGDCATLLKALGTLGNEWSKRYIAEVIVGVDDLHKRGIIHRDLKPDNLLIDSKGHLKLTDFGLSRMGIVGRQVRSQRKSSTSEQAIEQFRRNFCSQSSQSPLTTSSTIADDSPVLEYSHKRTNSVTPFSLSPTMESSKLALGPHSLSYSGNMDPSGGQALQNPLLHNRSNSYFKGRSGSNSSALDSPLLKPILPTTSDSSFALIEDDFQVSQSQNPITNYALFDPQNESEFKKFVGTPDYLAPETIKGVGQSESSDWWSIGCMLFEFLFGYPPFHAQTPAIVFKRILSGEIDWPPLPKEEERKYCSAEAKDLIIKLLTLDPEERLGFNGAEEIMEHPYFQSVNWHTLFDEEAPFAPQLEDPTSTDYFDLRGAEMSQFPKEDTEDLQHPSIKTTELGSPTVGTGSSLIVPALSGSKKERRGSRLADPSEFGSFYFRNLNVLEKANKDVINRLKTEHLEHRNSFSSSSSESTPTSRSRGYSFNGVSNTSPFKRPVSPATPIGRSASPNKESISSQASKGERFEYGLGNYSSGDECSLERISPGSEISSKKMLNPLPKQILKSVDFSPPNSDNEDSALMRVKKRRESARRMGSFSNERSFTAQAPSIDVLYCESITAVRTSVTKLLERCGCIVVAISDGDELVRRATGQVKFDLIFTALKLQKIEAIDAVKLIKFTTGFNTNTPIIALTGSKDAAEDSNVFDHIIEKPIEYTQLQKCINHFIKLNDDAIESDSEK